MTAENQAKIEELIDSLLPSGMQHKPHKLLLLLAWARLRYRGELEDRIVYYCPELVNEFKTLFDRFRADGDRNRPYNPFFHLRTSGVWSLIPNEGQEHALEAATTIGGPGDLNRLVKGALLEGVLNDMLHDRELNLAFQRIAEQRLSSHQTNGGSQMENPFVAYLNTLQGTDANNKGSLAESQAKNPLFKELRVPHPLAQEILAELTGENGGNVILTGHAGDGKSTLALEVIRVLRKLPPDDPLKDGLKKREIISCGERTVSVVKDLSECKEDERGKLADDLFRPGSGERFLIVSNTGPLLSLFQSNCGPTGENVATVEDRLLGAMDSDVRRTFPFGPVSFAVHNLARKDNLDIGLRMLERMVRSPQWDRCGECPASGRCPLLANRNLLERHFALASRRIRLLYFRAYAYGERLTMRQMAAHFSFLLTGGATCREMAARVASGAEIHPERHLFTNLFWGDDGEKDVPQAVRQLHAVSAMREQRFDARYSPREERAFWNFGGRAPLAATDATLADLERRIRGGKKAALPGRDAALARRQYRRLAFFLGSPAPEGDDGFPAFLSAFLDSPRILDVQGWRDDPSSFKARSLAVPIYCVLQEEFSGMRPPEGTGKAGTLFITLGRRGGDIRQSVQLVLSKFDFHDHFEIRLVDGTPALCGIGRLDGIRLDLPLPFLDYLTARNKGELGRGLQRSYRDRLEDLKARILATIRSGDVQGLVLLRRQTDGSLSTVSVKPSDGANALEVIND